MSFIIGDIKGQSLLCGLYGNYSSNRIHHSCNCSFADSDVPTFHCTWLEWCKLKSLVVAQDKERLKALSQHMVDNAFYKLDFCDEVHGVHGSTPVGSLHALQLGFVRLLP